MGDEAGLINGEAEKVQQLVHTKECDRNFWSLHLRLIHVNILSVKYGNLVDLS